MACSSATNRRYTVPLSLLSRFLSLLAASVLIFAAPVGHAGQTRNSARLNGADAQFKLVLEKIGQKRLDAVLKEVDQLTARYPNFRLARYESHLSWLPWQ